MTQSIITGDTSIIGNWYKMIASGATSTEYLYQTVSGITPRNLYAITGRIGMSTLTGDGLVHVELQFQNSSSTVLQQVWPVNFFNQALSSGVFYLEYVAPANTRLSATKHRKSFVLPWG